MSQRPGSRLRLETIEGVLVVHIVDDKIVGDETVQAIANELFRLTGLDRVFRIHADEQSALDSL